MHIVENTAYRTSKAHLNEEDALLPPCERAKVHRCEATNGHGADAVEERVDV
jgi:hypothetical protein